MHWSPAIADSENKLQLAETLVQILTPHVLAYLPPSLQVEQTTTAVLNWINDRAQESDVYLINNTHSKTLIGLLILVDDPTSEANLNIHIGYLLSQAAWRKGYASELIKGLLKEAGRHAPITLIGGVAKGNAASAHVLRKQGFLLDQNQSDKDIDVFTATIATD